MSDQSCTHNCSTCSANCSSREKQSRESMFEKPNDLSSVKHVIAVCSGKGGVGKSIVTSMLAVLMQRRGYKVGILDADVTGPSIPKAFGLNKDVEGDGLGMIPPSTTTGIDIMSVNLMLDDVTVFQSLPLDGIIIVSSPQDLVAMIVSKAAHMADMMNVPVLGLVENMSYAICPDCGKHIHVFGESHIGEIAEKFGYDLLGQIPLDHKLAALCDKGWIEMMENSYLEAAADALEAKCPVDKA